MAYVSILDKVRKKLKQEPIANTVPGAIKWYRDTIRKLSGYSGDSHYSRGSGVRNDLLADDKRARTHYFPGQMYLFVYDPKHKKTLPYYDKFPLVFFIGPCSDGTWLGINFHYLGYEARFYLFQELLTLADKHPTDPRALLKLSYKSLKTMARFKAFKPALHKYLPKHIESRLVRIEAPDWETALFLPVENFAKRSKTFVWKDSDAIVEGVQKGPTPISTNGLPKNSSVPKTPTTIKTVSTNGKPKS